MRVPSASQAGGGTPVPEAAQVDAPAHTVRLADGREIAFFSEQRLKRMSADGGPVQTVCEAAGAFSGSWGKDGTILFMSQYGGPILAVPASGGTPKPVTAPDAAHVTASDSCSIPVTVAPLADVITEYVNPNNYLIVRTWVATDACGNTNTASYGYQAFKGTPRLVYRVDAKTGKEELVRGVELVGTPLASVNKLLATSDQPRVFNGYCGAESGYVPVSTVAPAVLVGEIELQRVARATDRSPILPAPWTERATPGALRPAAPEPPRSPTP